MLVEHAELAGIEAVEGTDRRDLVVGVGEGVTGKGHGAPRYLPLSNNYLTLASIYSAPVPGASDHHDPAAQQRARGTAELAQHPLLRPAGVRRIAAEPVVMVAGDQEA